MFVETMLPTALKRLASVAGDTVLIEAAKPLGEDKIDLVVVCNAEGRLAGVITKTDVVRQICRNPAAATASQVMSRDVLFCRPGDLLRDIWSLMKTRSIKNIPIVSDDDRPIGVLNARDLVDVLVDEAEYEEGLLRDYVMSVGYR